MQSVQQEEREVCIPTNCFHLPYTLACGQCFRWEQVEGVDNEFIGVIHDRVLKIRQFGDNIYVKSSCYDQLEAVVSNYFDLTTPYQKIEEEISKIDDHVKQAVQNTSGIHILNQSFFETLLSFIISANNNIPRITKTIAMLSKRYGTKVMFEGKEYYLFPTALQLKHVTEEEFRECGTGFRARYLVHTVQDMLQGKLKDTLRDSWDTDTLKKQLMTLQGVGEKVADCILLFACQRKEVFPVDVWVERVMSLLYFKENKGAMKKKEIITFAQKRFGNYAGIVQQHLFYNIREKMI